MTQRSRNISALLYKVNKGCVNIAIKNHPNAVSFAKRHEVTHARKRTIKVDFGVHLLEFFLVKVNSNAS